MDLSLIQSQMDQHGFLLGLLAGTLLPAIAGPALGALTKLVLRMTAKVIPPIAAGVSNGVRWALAIPLVRAVILPHKKEVKDLEDALMNAATAILLAIDMAFDQAIDAAGAEPPAPVPQELPKP